MTNLVDYFISNLIAENAISQKQKDDAHRLRYAVYCEERGYEDPNQFPDNFERDEYDDESVHTIVRHRQTAHPLGVVRLVLPNQLDLGHSFPIEQYFGHLFDESTLQDFNFSRHNIAEVSRFAISRKSLQKISSLASTSAFPFDNTQVNRRSTQELIPHITLGLIAMLFVVSQKHNITYWYAAMEPSLSRLLTRLGIVFTKIGPLINYHGKRQPMIAKVADLLKNIYYERYDFFKLIEMMGGTVSFDEQLLFGGFEGQAGVASVM